MDIETFMQSCEDVEYIAYGLTSYSEQIEMVAYLIRLYILK